VTSDFGRKPNNLKPFQKHIKLQTSDFKRSSNQTSNFKLFVPVTFSSFNRPTIIIQTLLNYLAMKQLTIFILLFTFCTGLFSQELDSLKTIMENKQNTGIRSGNDTSSVMDDTDDPDEVNIKLMDKEILKVVDDTDSVYLSVGDNGNIQATDQPDSTTIRVGNKEIKIVERGNHTDITMEKSNHTHPFNPKFRGHWAGFEWGINNFLDNDFTLSRENETVFMDLNTSRSWAINLNFAQYSLGFGTSHFGAVVGMGIEFNNYFFDRENTIIEEDDYVVEVDLSDTTSIAKSKLSTTYIRVPLIFEVQFPNVARARRMFISAGLITGLKLGSHTKVVYKGENGKSKDKNNDDFNLSPFRYGLTARMGFGNVSIFGDYYFSPVFVENKGPHLHPFTIGMAFNF